MDNLTPITREEILMNDEPLTPITREEKILAGEDLNPVTRREYFLKKYRHAGGDVMVEGLSVTANGTYTAPEDKAYSPVEVAVPLPENAYLLKTASGSLVSFSDGADLPMPSFICNITANQDLHGYDHPWVGGAGKNKLQNTQTTQEIKGITFTVNSDGSVTANGTATAEVEFTIYFDTSTVYGDLYFVGCSGGSNSTYNVFMWDNTANSRVKKWDGTTASDNSFDGTFQQVKIVQGNAVCMVLRIKSGQTVNNVTFYPMICLSTETDPTFAPYSNICPISGHTGVDAWVRGKNLCPVILSDDASATGYTATVENDGVIIVNGTWTGTNNNIIGVNEQVKFNLPAGSYIISGATVDNYNDYGICLQVFNWNTSQVLGKTSTTGYVEFTLETQTEVSVRIYVYNSKASGKTIPSGGIKLYPMIRLASIQDATYEPYNPNSQTIQVSWRTEAGEVFGGYVDLVSGVLTVVGKYKLFDGSENWTITSNVYLELSDMKSGTRQDGLCNYFPVRKSGDSGDNLKIQFGANGVGANSLYIINAISSGYDTLEKVQALTTGMQIVYPLATPITYQLTPTQIKSLRGNNNAWCSTGDVDIDYFAKEVTG